jgi:hypothetical protein
VSHKNLAHKDSLSEAMRPSVGLQNLPDALGFYLWGTVSRYSCVRPRKEENQVLAPMCFFSGHLCGRAWCAEDQGLDSVFVVRLNVLGTGSLTQCS